MSLLWDYEEKTHRIITGRKRKRFRNESSPPSTTVTRLVIDLQ